ncbi:MAG: hypothetical protein GY950_09315 [bacterium]|nr:hypothetical protein [bacterium]
MNAKRFSYSAIVTILLALFYPMTFHSIDSPGLTNDVMETKVGGPGSEFIPAHQKAASNKKSGKNLSRLQQVRVLGNDSVRLTTIPSKTTVKVWNGRYGEFKYYISEVFINWRVEDLKWWFSWETKEKGVTSAVWQVSLIPFASSKKNWLAPAGIVASEKITSIPKKGGTAHFKIDFASFAPRPTDFKKKTNKKSKRRLGLPAKKSGKSKLKVPGITNISTGNIVSANTSMNFRRMIPYSRITIMPRRTYYVRLVPLDYQGRPVGVPSPPVKVDYGQPTPQEGFKLYPMGRCYNPGFSIISYEPIRWRHAKAQYHFVVLREIPGFPWKEGDKVYLPPKKGNKDILDRISNTFESFFDFIENTVNWVSDAYESIKAETLKFITSALKSTVGCGSVCKQAFALALDTGLMAIGLPPSIPDFDELTRMGKDYLIKKIAEEAGIPEEIAQQGVDFFIEKAKEASNGGGASGIWLKPDPDYLYRPAILKIQVVNTNSFATSTSSLTIRDFKRIFKNISVTIPRLKPGEKVVIPVFLEPNALYLQTVYSPSSFPMKKWYELYWGDQTFFNISINCSHISGYQKEEVGSKTVSFKVKPSEAKRYLMYVPFGKRK